MIRTGNEKTGNALIHVPVKAGELLNENTIAVIGADGYAIPGKKAEGLIVAGRTEAFADNRNGADGAVTVEVKRGVFVWNNDGTIKQTDILKTCYVSDETTVTITADGASAAGIILAVDEDGVTVDMTQSSAAKASSEE